MLPTYLDIPHLPQYSPPNAILPASTPDVPHTCGLTTVQCVHWRQLDIKDPHDSSNHRCNFLPTTLPPLGRRAADSSPVNIGSPLCWGDCHEEVFREEANVPPIESCLPSTRTPVWGTRCRRTSGDLNRTSGDLLTARIMEARL